MLLRHLVSHFLQQQAKAKFSEAMRKGTSADPSSIPRATPMDVDGLIVFPSELEAGGVLDLVEERQISHCETFTEQTGILSSRRVALVELGEGEFAGKKMATALKLIHPLWVLSIGFASGISPVARRGQIMMASRIINMQGEARCVGLTLAANQEPLPGIHWGELLTVDRIPKTLAEKKSLVVQNAMAWDADSYFVAEAVAGAITFISVRIISEAIDDELPQAIKFIRNQKSLAAKLGAAAGALLDNPSSLQAMWKLRDEAIKLSDRLARFLLGVVEQLPQRKTTSVDQKT